MGGNVGVNTIGRIVNCEFEFNMQKQQKIVF